jgi:YidC/Oxa1 family membrane protein insertase
VAWPGWVDRRPGLVIRILLIPLFVKQINAQRGLQMLQPEMKKLQAKYKGKSDPDSKKKQQEEMMKLYKDNGTNPVGSCLPIVLQGTDLLCALPGPQRHRSTSPSRSPRGCSTARQAQQAADAQIFGAHLSDKFIGADSLNVQIVCAGDDRGDVGVDVPHPEAADEQEHACLGDGHPFAQQQKILLYVFPLIFASSGVNFPVGVLLYWLTTNLWTMGQQFYVIRRNPAPDRRRSTPWRNARPRRPPGRNTRPPLPRQSARPRPLTSRRARCRGHRHRRPDTNASQRQQPRRQPERKR